MHPLLLLKAISALRKGRLGDAVAYKAAGFTASPYVETSSKVERLADPLPDFATLSSSPAPEGSLGHSYIGFVARCGITPLAISPGVRSEVASLNLVAARYVLLHDLFHVLLGFGIDRPGELAVWSFVAEQRYSPSYEHAAALANWLYPLLEPSAKSELRRQRAKAIQLAREVPCLLAQPLELYWSQPLQAVRSHCGIHIPNDA